MYHKNNGSVAKELQAIYGENLIKTVPYNLNQQLTYLIKHYAGNLVAYDVMELVKKKKK